MSQAERSSIMTKRRGPYINLKGPYTKGPYNIIVPDYVAVDTTPPVLTGLLYTNPDFEVGTNELGTGYWLINNAATELAGTAIEAAVIAETPVLYGTWTVVNGLNEVPIDTTSLAAGTWYLHVAQEDLSGNIVATGLVEDFVIAAAPSIAYVGGKTAFFAGITTNPASISLTDLTGGLASAPIEGDLVLVNYGIGGGVDVDVTVVTADYVEISDLRANDDNDANMGLFRKFMTSTPDTALQVGPTTNATYAGAVAIHVWRGVNTTTPLDVAAVNATGTNTGQPTPGAITPTTAGSVIVIAGVGAAAATSVFTASELSNFITAASPDTIDAVVGMGSIAWTSGTFTPATWGGNTTASTDSWVATTIALRPA
jgi:hypothetical protein